MTLWTPPAPVSFGGVPWTSWAFAIRIWIAVVVALYAAFWLQLEAPSSAALTVAILAIPTRGPALEKAGFRLIATIIGVAASIAIVGIFSQARDLLLLAFAAWLGLCVYVAGLADGNRAYAAVLSGYTVAFIAIQQIDAPQHIFESGMARGAAIAVGIVAVAIVNDLLVAPDRHPALMAQLADIHRRVRDHARAIARGDAADGVATALLLREIAALRPEMTSLATESSSGWTRRAAARNTAVALVAELQAARALGALPIASDAMLQDRVTSVLGRSAGEGSPAVSIAESPVDAGGSSLAATALKWASGELLRRDHDVCEGLADLRAGVRPMRIWRTPLYCSHRLAAAAGVRAATWFGLPSVFFVLAGWPAADASLSLVAVLIGLGATTPDPRGFTAVAFFALPIAIVLVGVLEFLVLDGATEFPLLAIALGPFMVGATALMTVRHPVLSALGRLNLIFILAIFVPANPQTYNPQAFLFSSLFVCVAVALLFAAQLLVAPVSDAHRRQQLIASARRELDCLGSRKARRYSPEEAMFRDAGRIAQIAGTGAPGPESRLLLQDAVAMFDQAAMVRLCDATLDALPPDRLAAEVHEARNALARRDAGRVRQAAYRLQNAATEEALASTTSGILFAASVVMGTASSPAAIPVKEAAA